MTSPCPGCGQPPYLVLDDGRQCLCRTETCRVIMWNGTLTPDELANEVGVVVQLIPPEADP